MTTEPNSLCRLANHFRRLDSLMDARPGVRILHRLSKLEGFEHARLDLAAPKFAARLDEAIRIEHVFYRQLTGGYEVPILTDDALAWEHRAIDRRFELLQALERDHLAPT